MIQLIPLEEMAKRRQSSQTMRELLHKKLIDFLSSTTFPDNKPTFYLNFFYSERSKAEKLQLEIRETVAFSETVARNLSAKEKSYHLYCLSTLLIESYELCLFAKRVVLVIHGKMKSPAFYRFSSTYLKKFNPELNEV